jgi:hypothetical protein
MLSILICKGEDMKHLSAFFGKALIFVPLLVLLLLAGTGLNAHAQAAKPAGLPSDSTICTGATVPNYYIVYNDVWNPTECGDPTSNTDYNVQDIEPYYNVALDGSLTVCSYAPIPTGWTLTSTTWNPTACGHPTTMTNNVQTIERTSIGTPLISTGGVVNGTDDSPNDIDPGTVVSIFGVNFNAPDLVVVTQGSNQWVIQSGSANWFDTNPMWAQINATLPSTLTAGFATVYVQNAEGERSAGSSITIV